LRTNGGNPNKVLGTVKYDPPSTTKSVPVMYPAAGLPKKSAALEMSCVTPNLCVGIIDFIYSRAVGGELEVLLFA